MQSFVISVMRRHILFDAKIILTNQTANISVLLAAILSRIYVQGCEGSISLIVDQSGKTVEHVVGLIKYRSRL